ncbi:hypothetical protein AC578_7908 [Pseudocercospora eumusae]|uniref:Uncharacterized protein n=1 Tax=Pseudocercospora eumusae TaxID=321146 RepID=A0A139HPI5_9PEZI|nr:hypothetical protein AC578_7908 [Pseudocercospora eumusae]
MSNLQNRSTTLKAPDHGKPAVRRAKRVPLLTIDTTLKNGEKQIAKSSFDTGCGNDDFFGACEEKANVLQKIQPEIKTPSKNVDRSSGTKRLLEQEMCVDEAGKFGKLGEDMFSKDEYGKARQELAATAAVSSCNARK